MRMPHFHGKNPAEFRIWYAMAHQQGFTSMYTERIDMLILRQVEAPKVSSVLIRVAYMGKPVSLGDMDQNNHTMMIVHTI